MVTTTQELIQQLKGTGFETKELEHVLVPENKLDSTAEHQEGDLN